MVGMIVLLVIILVLVLVNVRVVPQTETYIIERLGKFKTIWEAGIHVKVPLIDQITSKVSLKEQVLDFPPQPVITKDNVTMQIDSVVFMKVFDPKLYTYGINNPHAGLENLSATTLRNIIGEMELDQTLTSREVINAKMQGVLDEATDPWGIRVTRVEIKNIKPPQEIEEVMTKQMRAERERRQTVLEAQAHQEAVVSRAEGDKKAKILAAEAERDAKIATAEGEARSLLLVSKAKADGIKMLNEAEIQDSVLKLRGIEALKDMADGRATKIYMPTDMSDFIASLGVAGEALGVGDHTPIDKTPKAQKAPAADPCVTNETSRGGWEAADTSAQINRDVDNLAH
ncbi:MAG: SPFH domain-containing protein [Pseudoramibacter sp.]|jgi:regulator of protease activity HflC (stomatin/prohibitin superfamily)